MNIHRLRLVLACAGALAAIAVAPGSARADFQWAPCEDGTLASCVPPVWCDYNDPNQSVCVEQPSIDPNNICLGEGGQDPCVSGLEDQVRMAGEEARQAAEDAVPLAGAVVGLVLGATDPVFQQVEELREQPICVGPFAPERPVCINP